MRKITLISCVKKKLGHKAKAKDLYVSNLFRLCYRYALTLKPDAIYILSAKYNLIEANQEIEPYELTLNTMGKSEVSQWANTVLNQLEKVSDLRNDKFILLAGDKYRKHLIPEMSNYDIPLKGLTLGRQMSWLKRNLN